jgi:hypothetical protein
VGDAVGVDGVPGPDGYEGLRDAMSAILAVSGSIGDAAIVIRGKLGQDAAVKAVLDPAFDIPVPDRVMAIARLAGSGEYAGIERALSALEAVGIPRMSAWVAADGHPDARLLKEPGICFGRRSDGGKINLLSDKHRGKFFSASLALSGGNGGKRVMETMGDGFVVPGDFYINRVASEFALPSRLRVGGILCISESRKFVSLPPGLEVFGELKLVNVPSWNRSIPDDAIVHGRVFTPCHPDPKGITLHDWRIAHPKGVEPPVEPEVS